MLISRSTSRVDPGGLFGQEPEEGKNEEARGRAREGRSDEDGGAQTEQHLAGGGGNDHNHQHHQHHHLLLNDGSSGANDDNGRAQLPEPGVATAIATAEEEEQEEAEAEEEEEEEGEEPSVEGATAGSLASDDDVRERYREERYRAAAPHPFKVELTHVEGVMQLNDGRLVTWLRGRNALLWAKDFDKNDQLVFTPCYEMDDRNLHDSTVQVIQLRSGKLASENYNNTIYIWTVRKLKTIQKYKPVEYDDGDFKKIRTSGEIKRSASTIQASGNRIDKMYPDVDIPKANKFTSDSRPSLTELSDGRLATIEEDAIVVVRLNDTQTEWEQKESLGFKGVMHFIELKKGPNRYDPKEGTVTIVAVVVEKLSEVLNLNALSTSALFKIYRVSRAGDAALHRTLKRPFESIFSIASHAAGHRMLELSDGHLAEFTSHEPAVYVWKPWELAGGSSSGSSGSNDSDKKGGGGGGGGGGRGGGTTEGSTAVLLDTPSYALRCKGANLRDIVQLKDGRIAVAAAHDVLVFGRLPVESTKTQEKLGPELNLEGHRNEVLSLIQLKDGRLASGAKDRSVRIWIIPPIKKRQERVENSDAHVVTHFDSLFQKAMTLTQAKFKEAQRLSSAAMFMTSAAAEDFDVVNSILEMQARLVVDGLIELVDGRLVSLGSGACRLWNLGLLDLPRYFGVKELGVDMNLDDVAEKIKVFIKPKFVDPQSDERHRVTDYKKFAMLIEAVVRRIGCGDAEIPVEGVVKLLDSIEHLVADEEDGDTQQLLLVYMASTIKTLASHYPADDFFLLQRINGTIGDESTILLAQTAMFRSLITVKYRGGPQQLFVLEFIQFILFGICFIQVQIYDAADNKKHTTYKVLHSLSQFFLAFLTLREGIELISTFKHDEALQGPEMKCFIAGFYTSVAAWGIALSLAWEARKKDSTSFATSTHEDDVKFVKDIIFYGGVAILFYPLILYIVVRALSCALYLKTKSKISEALDPLKTYRHYPLVFCLSAAWREDFWNWIDFVCLLSCWVMLTRHRWDHPHSRTLSSAMIVAVEDIVAQDTQVWPIISNFLIWLKLIGSLKSTSLKFSTFVTMIQRIISDTWEFNVVMFFLIFMFANVSYLRHKGPKAPELEDDAPNPYGPRLSHALHSTYLLGFLGDFEKSTFPAWGDMIILDIFIFIINVVMLNVLIAIISESFDQAMSASFSLYWAARYHIVREEIGTFGFIFRDAWRQDDTQVLDIVTEHFLTGDHAKEQQQGKISDIENRVKRNTKAEVGRLGRQLKEVQTALDDMREEKKQRDASMEDLHEKIDRMQKMLEVFASSSSSSSSSSLAFNPSPNRTNLPRLA